MIYGMKLSVLALLLCATGMGQILVLRPSEPFEDLKQYLSLTEVQYQTLLKNESTYSDFVRANPPIAGFDQIATSCPDAAVTALMDHVLAALTAK